MIAGAFPTTCCEAAYSLLQLSVSSRHGNLQMLAASVLQKLTPALLGQTQGSSKRGGAGTDRRAAALEFVKDLNT